MGSSRYALTLDNHDGALLGSPPAAYSGLIVGGQLNISLGYRSGTAGAAEYGVQLVLTVDRITHRLADGRMTTTVAASGPLDQAQHWTLPQTWQTAAGALTRVASRTGFPTTQAGAPRAPSSDFTASTPSLALPAGIHGDAAIAALFAPLSDGVRSESGLLQVVGISTGDATDYAYGPTAHPIAALELVDAPPRHNWTLLQGPDRYDQSFDLTSLYQHGPRRDQLRNLHATTNALATSYAAGARARARWGDPSGDLRAGFNAAQQLFDVVTVQESRLGLSSPTAYRVVGCGLDYARGPAGARYDSVLTLAPL